MYADDVAVVVSAPSQCELERKLNQTASQLSQWFEVNGLVLNLRKTHFMDFDLSGKPKKPINVMINGTRLEHVESTCFLGFHLDRCMTWEPHIDKVCGRLSGACFALRRISRVVTPEVARKCYFAIVHSILQYGVELYGCAAEWNRVFVAQKRAIRLLAHIPQDCSARPYFRSLKILTFPSLFILSVATYVRKNLDLYKRHKDVHGRNTRNAGNLVPIKSRLVKAGKLTHVIGPRVYNKLPQDVTDAPSEASFKVRLKKWLIEQAFYSFDDFLML
ncbi:hypothetical protein O0L34_g1813 [Tuta absoluta]|nr:hypothetical protein O0L34_g1813 [Tuta absoluta]